MKTKTAHEPISLLPVLLCEPELLARGHYYRKKSLRRRRKRKKILPSHRFDETTPEKAEESSDEIAEQTPSHGRYQAHVFLEGFEKLIDHGQFLGHLTVVGTLGMLMVWEGERLEGGGRNTYPCYRMRF